MPLSELLRALETRRANAIEARARRDRAPDRNSLEAKAAGASGDRTEASSDNRRRRPSPLGRFLFFRWRGGARNRRPGEDDDAADEDCSPLPPYPEAYELQEVVGRGMTAVVYAARVVDTSTSAPGDDDGNGGGDDDDDDNSNKRHSKKKKKPKRVAAKIVDLDALSDSAMEAVLRETRLLGKLRHRGLMPARASFVAGPRLWLVLPLAAASARDVLDRVFPGRGLPERSAAAIVAAVAEVLAYAHAQGVVHRDVKAQNVLLSLDNEESDDDEGGDEEGDDDGERNKKVSSSPHRPPPLGRARLSDLGSGNAADALMSMRGGSFKGKLSADLCCPSPSSSSSSSSSFPPPGSASASLTGGSGSPSGGSSSKGVGRVSFSRTSLNPLPEIGEGGALFSPTSSSSPFQQQQQQQQQASPSSDNTAAGGAAAAAARAAAARRLSRFETFAGSPAWMAPEIVEQGPGGYHGPACDVYSLGALLVELATGQPPMSHLPYERLMMEKLHGAEQPSLDLRRTGGYCASAAELAAACLRRDPRARPSAREVLGSSWLRGALGGAKVPGGCEQKGGAAAGGTGGGGGDASSSSSSPPPPPHSSAQAAAAAALAASEEIGALIELYREAKDEGPAGRAAGAKKKAAGASAAETTASLPRPSPPSPLAPASLLCSKSAVEALKQRRRKESDTSSGTPHAALLSSGRAGSSSISSNFVTAALRKFGSGSNGGSGAVFPASAGESASGDGEDKETDDDEDPSSSSSPPWDTSCDPRDVFGPEWARGVLRLQLFPSAVKARLSEAAASNGLGRKKHGGGGVCGGLRAQARAAVLEPPISSFFIPEKGGDEEKDDEDGEEDKDGENDTAERLRCFRDSRAVLVMCRDVRAPRRGSGAAAAAAAAASPTSSSSPSAASRGVDTSYSRALAAVFFRVPTVPQPLTLAEKGLLPPPAGAAAGDDAAATAAAIAAAREGGHGSVPAGCSAWAGPIYFFVTQRADGSLDPGEEALAERLRRERELWEAGRAPGGAGAVAAGGEKSQASSAWSSSSSEYSGGGGGTGGDGNCCDAPSSLGRSSSSALPPIPDAGEEEEEEEEDEDKDKDKEKEASPRVRRMQRLTSTKSESSYILEPTSRRGNLSGAPSLSAPRRAESVGEGGGGGVFLPEPSPLPSPRPQPLAEATGAAAAAAAAAAALVSAPPAETEQQQQQQQLPTISLARRQSSIGKLFMRLTRTSTGSGGSGAGGGDPGGESGSGERSAESRSGRKRGSTPRLEEAPPPQRALQACSASVVAAQMLLPPASGEAAPAKRGGSKGQQQRQKQEQGRQSKQPDDVDAAGRHRPPPPPLLPATLLGATLHIFRTPHAAGRLAFLLVKASEVAAAARAQEEEEEEEERRRNASSSSSSLKKKKNKEKKKKGASNSLSQLPAFRIGSEPLVRIPGDDLPPAVTLAAGAVGPLFTATATTATTAQDDKGQPGTKDKKLKKGKAAPPVRWLVPSEELTAAAHGKARCCVGSSGGGGGGSGRGGGSGSGSSGRAVGTGAEKGSNVSSLDISALLAGRVPPPPSWAEFIEDLQGAQELATRAATKGSARATRARAGQREEEGEAPPLQPPAPLELETAKSILSSGSIPVSPFSAAPSTASPLPGRGNSSG